MCPKAALPKGNADSAVRLVKLPSETGAAVTPADDAADSSNEMRKSKFSAVEKSVRLRETSVEA